jgi:hypothetical protein
MTDQKVKQEDCDEMFAFRWAIVAGDTSNLQLQLQV